MNALFIGASSLVGYLIANRLINALGNKYMLGKFSKPIIV
jgi:hypothetical protein